MTETNRKLIFVAVALMAAAMLTSPLLIGTAYAGKGQTKQAYEFYLEGYYAPDENTKMWITEGGIEQVRNLLYYATYIEVTVGGTTYYPDPASYSGTMDATIDLNTQTLNIRVHESFAVAGGIIDQQTAERVTDYGTANLGGGSFVGHGSGALEGVKVKGTTGMVGTGLDRVGVVMGWP